MHKLSAIEISNKFKKGELSALEITKYYFQRIHQHEKSLGCYLSLLEERALHRATKLDEKKAKGEKLGKLAAIPIALKDNMHVKGELTTCASKFLTNYVAPFDATVTKLIEQEDGIIIAKANLDEFAMGGTSENSAFKKAANPWNLNCHPGGSSGGSAAAVSARLACLALGSDTGGSVRLPASHCGIVGYKPSYGRVSRYGLVAFGSSLDQIGPLATNTEDIALFMEVIGKHCIHDATSAEIPSHSHLENLKKDLKGVTIGVPWEFLEDLPEEASKIFSSSIDKMKNLGANTIPVDLKILKYSIAVYYILATAEASTNLARFDGIRYGERSQRAQAISEVYEFSRSEGFGEEVKRRILLGTFVLSSGYQEAYYKKAQKIRTLMIKAFKECYKNCNLIALPNSSKPTFEFGIDLEPIDHYLMDLYTTPANFAGLPAISVPASLTSNNLPVGIQLIGPQMHDADVIAAAHAFEKANDFNYVIPPLFT